MRLKKKAGLALALAAIFTTGAASAALADNVTIGGNGTSTVTVGSGTVDGPDKQGVLNNVTPTNGTVTLDATAQTLTVSNVVIEATGGAAVNTLAIDGGLNLAGNGGELVTANGQAVENLNVADNSGLSLGLSGNDRSENSGTIRNVNFADSNATGSNPSGFLDVANGSFSAENITATNINGSINVIGADFTVNSIQATGANNIDISLFSGGGGGKSRAANGTADDNNTTTFIVKNNANLGTGTARANFGGWGYDKTIRQIYMGDFQGSLELYANSLTSIGTSDAGALDRVFSVIGPDLSQDGTDFGTQSALGIFSPTTIATGTSYTIYNTTTGGTPSAPDSLAFYSFDTLQVLDASSGTPLTFEKTGGGDVTFGGTYNNLYVIGARAGADTALISNINSISAGVTPITKASQAGQLLADMAALHSWTGDDSTLIFSSPLLTNGQITVTGPDNNLTIGVTAEAVSASIYGDFQSGGVRLVDGIYGHGANSVHGFLFNAAGDITGFSAGVQLVSRATDNFYTHYSNAASTVEGAAQMAVAGGAPGLLNTFANVMADAIGGKYSLMGDLVATAAGSEPGGFGVWVNPYYRSVDVDGMSAGHFKTGYDADFGGAVLGLDYNVNENFRLGLGFNVGGGDSESQGDFYKTDNDFDFWGLSLFGSYTFGNWGLTADLGYTSSSNDITQKLPSSFGLGHLKADVDAEAFTVGLTGEYLIELESMKLMPHLGIRYTSLKTDDYDVKARGGLGKVFGIESERQNVWSIPVGLTLSQSYLTEGGWTITPKADLGAIFSFGDTEVDTTARVFGTGARGTMSADVIDKAVFNGTLGIKAAADNGLSLGLDYNIQASGDTTSHGFSGMLRYEF
ncbi:hypothetical protein C4J81_19015 (plasmid) [Deltaproteobacteria bacterium Smac51]|nr:hypothetical protein C4J81_19015 [Deltaproteobacteria bacterium Smac51]